MPKKLTQGEFLKKVEDVHGKDHYDLSQVVYVHSKEKIIIICPVHGEFRITPTNLMRGQGCKWCGVELRINKLRSTKTDFLEKARKVHKDRYILDKVQYTGAREKVKIVCREHGPWLVQATSFLSGYGCPQCGFESTANKLRLTQNEFISKALKAHKDTYDLSRAVYGIGNRGKVKIVCRKHGPWMIQAGSFLQGRGCPQCANEKRSEERSLTRTEFLERAIRMWGDHYILDNAQYKSAKEKILIICRDHGEFEITPDSFLRGSGCVRCSHVGPSKGEDEVATFVESLGFNSLRSDRTILRPLELDIYVPEKNLAIEFNGYYFHNDQRKDKKYHYDKYKQCKEQGIRLIQIMDIIWETRQEQAKSLLTNALGMTDGQKIDARKCQVQEVKIAQLKAFFEQNHIQGHVHTAKLAMALVYEGEIVAGMSFGKGTNQRGKAREGKEAVWTLSRYATSCLVRGGFQKLLKHGRQIIGMDQSIVTYSMNDYFSGNMYAQAGFRMDGEVAPDYQVYHYRCGLKPKSHWQRRNIPARLEEIGWEDTFDPNTDERTEWEVENEVGALRIWDSGKTRWLLEKQKCAT